MPSRAVTQFIARQREAGLRDLKGLNLELRLPLPERDLNLILNAGASSHDIVESIRLTALENNRAVVEIVTRTPALDLPGLGWLTRGLLGLDLASRSLRLDFDLVQNTFSWPNSPFLVLRLPAGITGSTQATVLKSAVLPRLPAELQSAVDINNRDILLNIRALLERGGLGMLGPSIRTLSLSSTAGRIWLTLHLQVRDASPAPVSAPKSNASKPPTDKSHDAPAIAMKEIIERHLANGLADFAGLRCAGQLPIREELLNELLTEFLQKSTAPDSSASTEPAMASTSDRPDLAPLLRRVKRAAVRLEEGVMTLHFEVGVDK